MPVPELLKPGRDLIIGQGTDIPGFNADPLIQAIKVDGVTAAIFVNIYPVVWIQLIPFPAGITVKLVVSRYADAVKGKAIRASV